MPTILSRNNINKFISASLTLWLSGLIFLLCCEMPQAQAAEKDSCPLAKISHCNKKKTAEGVSQFASFQTENRALDCCILPNIFDKARKVEQNQQTALTPTTLKIPQSRFLIVENKFYTPKFYRSPLLDRSGTYLKNQVFRI